MESLDWMLWLSWLTLSISAGSTAETWTSWCSVRWVKRSREQSSSFCWDHIAELLLMWGSIWCSGWWFVCFEGVWVSLLVCRPAWICFSLFIQPFLKATSSWLSAWEIGNKKEWDIQNKDNSDKHAAGKEENIDFYPLLEPLGNLDLVNPPGRPHVPTW